MLGNVYCQEETSSDLSKASLMPYTHVQEERQHTFLSWPASLAHEHSTSHILAAPYHACICKVCAKTGEKLPPASLGFPCTTIPWSLASRKSQELNFILKWHLVVCNFNTTSEISCYVLQNNIQRVTQRSLTSEVTYSSFNAHLRLVGQPYFLRLCVSSLYSVSARRWGIPSQASMRITMTAVWQWCPARWRTKHSNFSSSLLLRITWKNHFVYSQIKVGNT